MNKDLKIVCTPPLTRGRASSEEDIRQGSMMERKGEFDHFKEVHQCVFGAGAGKGKTLS